MPRVPPTDPSRVAATAYDDLAEIRDAIAAELGGPVSAPSPFVQRQSDMGAPRLPVDAVALLLEQLDGPARPGRPTSSSLGEGRPQRDPGRA